MSEYDEPPHKLGKMEMSSVLMEDMEESGSQGHSQEEWLSEGVLTDDDYNPIDQDPHMSNLGTTSQEESTMNSLNDSSLPQLQEDAEDPAAEHSFPIPEAQSPKHDEAQSVVEQDEPAADTDADDIGRYLNIKKKEEEKEPPQSVTEKKEDDTDDGNDTDELLRMLGEDNKKSKNLSKVKPSQGTGSISKNTGSSDEDDLDKIFEGAKVLKKTVLTKTLPKNLKRHNISDSEVYSSDDTTPRVSRPSVKKLNVAAKSTSKPAHPSTGRRGDSNDKVTRAGVAASVSSRNVQKPPPKASSTPNRSLLKQQTSKKTLNGQTDRLLNKMSAKAVVSSVRNEVTSTKTGDKVIKKMTLKKEPEEEEEEDDEDEEDPEEHLTEEQTDSDGSFYDDILTSESEEIEDWFTIDIRAERAGDYIPLLADKAYSLLSKEKEKVSLKLSTIRESLSQLVEKSRKQTKEIEGAKRTLGELDAVLTHT